MSRREVTMYQERLEKLKSATETAPSLGSSDEFVEGMRCALALMLGMKYEPRLPVVDTETPVDKPVQPDYTKEESESSTKKKAAKKSASKKAATRKKK